MASSKSGHTIPIRPKEVHYNANGTGRDKYIWFDNGGGFASKPEYPVGFEIGTFGGRNHYKQINTYRPARALHYAPDGTGRDTYVIVDEGGIAGNFYTRHNHLKSLRNYSEQHKNIDPNDFFTRSQFAPFKNTNTSLLKKSAQNQHSLTWRLSQPKRYEDPYSEVKRKTTLPGLRRVY